MPDKLVLVTRRLCLNPHGHCHASEFNTRPFIGQRSRPTHTIRSCLQPLSAVDGISAIHAAHVTSDQRPTFVSPGP
jgi:hypothetical protein